MITMLSCYSIVFYREIMTTNTEKLALAMVIAAAAVALVLAPSLTSTVLAKKTETEKCTNGGSDHECRGNSDEAEDATITTTCSAGKDGAAEPQSCNGAK
jgi:hypothetical protein